MKNRKGFTLTELLAVIAIMAILAVAAISGYSTMTKNSKKKTYESKVAEIEDAAVKFAKEINLRNSTTISVNKLVVQGYFQPDESTANGLAAVNNPINGDNMICNMVTISIYDDMVFYNTLLDENTATHLALGNSYNLGIKKSERGRINRSKYHIDLPFGTNDIMISFLDKNDNLLAVFNNNEVIFNENSWYS